MYTVSGYLEWYGLFSTWKMQIIVCRGSDALPKVFPIKVDSIELTFDALPKCVILEMANRV
jgi:hypothetical protein